MMAAELFYVLEAGEFKPGIARRTFISVPF